ncbi:MAG: hypothetical protein AAGG79_05995 [Pseudomonadota bacterium]
MRLIHLLAALALIACTPSENSNVGLYEMTVEGATARFANPPWLGITDDISPENLSEETRITPEGYAFRIWETIPPGDTFEAWRQLYAVTLEHPVSGSLEDQVNRLRLIYETACNGVTFIPSPPSDTSQTVLVTCEQYKNAPTVGEIAFFAFQLTDGVLMKNYHHTRVPAFSAEDENQPFEIGGEATRQTLARLGRSMIVETP